MQLSILKDVQSFSAKGTINLPTFSDKNISKKGRNFVPYLPFLLENINAISDVDDLIAKIIKSSKVDDKIAVNLALSYISKNGDTALFDRFTKIAANELLQKIDLKEHLHSSLKAKNTDLAKSMFHYMKENEGHEIKLTSRKWGKIAERASKDGTEFLELLFSELENNEEQLYIFLEDNGYKMLRNAVRSDDFKTALYLFDKANKAGRKRSEHTWKNRNLEKFNSLFKDEAYLHRTTRESEGSAYEQRLLATSDFGIFTDAAKNKTPKMLYFLTKKADEVGGGWLITEMLKGGKAGHYGGFINAIKNQNMENIKAIVDIALNCSGGGTERLEQMLRNWNFHSTRTASKTRKIELLSELLTLAESVSPEFLQESLEHLREQDIPHEHTYQLIQEKLIDMDMPILPIDIRKFQPSNKKEIETGKTEIEPEKAPVLEDTEEYKTLAENDFEVFVEAARRKTPEKLYILAEKAKEVGGNRLLVKMLKGGGKHPYVKNYGAFVETQESNNIQNLRAIADIVLNYTEDGVAHLRRMINKRAYRCFWKSCHKGNVELLEELFALAEEISPEFLEKGLGYIAEKSIQHNDIYRLIQQKRAKLGMAALSIDSGFIKKTPTFVF